MSRTLGTLLALILPSRGRHGGSARFSRRRRSTRVRRYVADPVPAAASRHTPAPSRPRPRLVEPRLAEPRQVLSADDVALVRPYYEAHEKHVARMRAAFQEDAGSEQKSSQATQPSQQPQSPQQPQVPQPPQLPEPRVPEGDLLAGETELLPEPASLPVSVPVPAPVPARGRHHRVDEAELDRELARLTRMWQVQRQNLQMGVPA
ncbi:hypothetical protein [Nocardiopsis algeriensis]|uniref:Uncharacterized protein n=1 Tax=Nocardiopsis algeriensis TaxID=1478215 RepID=A0A841IH93_9ACTN|nr:hypothetical protein [Nocardiopsis algeriensis]MBB6118089.1 hypothetical protein [Nocardiopsis algeriensis]